MSKRESALAAHHRTLGSNLEDWNGMGAPWTYNSDPCDEHDAVRERAGPVRRLGAQESPCAW